MVRNKPDNDIPTSPSSILNLDDCGKSVRSKFVDPESEPSIHSFHGSVPISSQQLTPFLTVRWLVASTK